MASSAKPATVSAANFPLDCCVVASGKPAVKNFGRVNHQKEAKAVILGGGFNIVYFHLYVGKWSNLTIQWYFSNGLKPPTIDLLMFFA